MKQHIDLPLFDGDALDVIMHRDLASYGIVIYPNSISISMNTVFMRDFAYQILYFVQNNLKPGDHIHYDAFCCPLIKGDFDILLSKDADDCYSLRIQKRQNHQSLLTRSMFQKRAGRVRLNSAQGIFSSQVMANMSSQRKFSMRSLKLL